MTVIGVCTPVHTPFFMVVAFIIKMTKKCRQFAPGSRLIECTHNGKRFDQQKGNVRCSVKRIEAVSVLDLRNYTPQALRKISSIQAVSTILLPENPSPAFAEAYADITKGAIAQEVFAPMDKVAQYNGLNVLGSTLPEGAICLCNGMTIFRRAAGEKHARVFLSGIGIAEQGTGLVIENLNGMFRELDRDLDHLHQFSAELRAGADLLSRLEDGAVIVVGSSLFFAPDVTPEMITDKHLLFIVGAVAVCPKPLLGTVQANSIVGNMVMDEEAYEAFRKKYKV